MDLRDENEVVGEVFFDEEEGDFSEQGKLVNDFDDEDSLEIMEDFKEHIEISEDDFDDEDEIDDSDTDDDNTAADDDTDDDTDDDDADTDDGKALDEYESVCFVCRRPEGKNG